MNSARNLFFSKTFWHLAVLFILCLISFGNSFNNGFLLDDYGFLLREDSLRSVSGLSLWIKAFRDYYRPVAFNLLRLESLAFGNRAYGYHIFNLVLFWLVCLMFYFILRKLFKNIEVPFLAASLYCVHPFNSFLVNYKTASNISFHLLFMQASVLFFIYYLDHRKLKLYVLSLAFYLLALLSHEISFMLPFDLFLLMYFLMKGELINHNMQVLQLEGEQEKYKMSNSSFFL